MKVYQLGLIAILLINLPSCSDTDNSEKKVKIVSWGGKFQEDLMNYWIKPASERANIPIQEGTWDGDYASLSSKISKNLNAWDLVHVEDYYINIPEKTKFFEKLPNSITDTIFDDYSNDYALPILEYGYILVLQKELIKVNNKITDSLQWDALWDIKNFPGKRALRDFPIGNIEIALLASGKNINTYLYDSNLTKSDLEIRVSEAILKLNELKDNLAWWTTGDQLQTSIERKENVLTAAWSGRVASAHKNICKTLDVNTCTIKAFPNSALVSIDWWIIPKNSTNKENTFKLLKEIYSKKGLDSAKSFSINQGYSIPVEELSVQDSIISFYLNIGSIRNKNKISKLDDIFWSKNFTWINKKWKDWRFK